MSTKATGLGSRKNKLISGKVYLYMMFSVFNLTTNLKLAIEMSKPILNFDPMKTSLPKFGIHVTLQIFHQISVR